MSQPLDTHEIALDIKDVLFILRKRLILILAVGIVFGAAGFLATRFLMTPIYEASAKMIVNTRPDQSAVVTNDQLNSAKNLVDTYAIIIRSKTVLGPVAEALGLGESEEVLRNRVSVTSVNGTQVMQISVRDPDPQQAYAITEEIVKTAPDIIMETVEAGSVKTIEAPKVGNGPISPDLRLYTILSALLGMILTALIFIVRFVHDNTFQSELDIQKRLDLPVLGIIPATESVTQRKGGR